MGATGPCAEAVTAVTTLASELLRAQAMQASKRSVFCACHGMAAFAEARAAAAAERAGGGGGGGGGGGSMDEGPTAAATPARANFAALASSLEVASTQVTRGGEQQQ